jgi:hypothetical protein
VLIGLTVGQKIRYDRLPIHPGSPGPGRHAAAPDIGTVTTTPDDRREPDTVIWPDILSRSGGGAARNVLTMGRELREIRVTTVHHI